MGESLVQVTEGSGKKLHTFQRSIGGQAVEDEVVIAGLPYLATYRAYATTLSITASHTLFQLMAGANLNLYIMRVRVYQDAGTTAGAVAMLIRRLTTAGTGGTAMTPIPHDTGDTAGATAMSLPATPGTSGAILFNQPIAHTAAAPFGPGIDDRWPWGLAKPWKIPAGATNGIEIVNASTLATGTVTAEIIFCEANF